MPREKGLYLRDIIPILNSFFKTAKVDVKIVELAFYKEQVVIGFPQIESLESELKAVERVDNCELGARYIALGTLFSSARLVSIYVRFYLTSDGRLITEDFGDDGVTLANPDEANKPLLWKSVITYATSWGPTIVKLILTYFGNITDNPQ